MPLNEHLTCNEIGARLFASSTVRAAHCNGDRPVYTQISRDECILNPNSLIRPQGFLAALQDYSKGHETEPYKPTDFIPDARADEMLKDAYSVLERSKLKYCERLTKEHVRQLLAGRCAELVVAETIRKMLKLFGKIPNAKLPRLREWNMEDRHQSKDLESGLTIVPVDKTNLIILGHKSSEGIGGLGEQDMLVETQEQSAFFVDVSTSEKTVEGKLRASKNEQSFSIFRRRITQLFQASLGEAGYRDVSKIHLILSDEALSEPKKMKHLPLLEYGLVGLLGAFSLNV